MSHTPTLPAALIAMDILYQIDNAAPVGTVNDGGVIGCAAQISDDIARQAGRSIDHVQSDAGDAATSSIKYPADDFVCIRFADGSTRSGVASYPDRLIVRRHTT